MADFKCTGECIKCSFQQQTYCAAQRGYAMMTYLPAIVERLDRIERVFGGSVFNPLEEPKAQKGSGAENRESDESNLS